MAITDAQQAKQIMMKKGGPVVQAGVKNYKPSKMVTVPKVAKSSPTHPTAKLAYITDAEKKLLIKKNLHGSLKGKPNRGPGGIPSLEGDFGGPGGFGGFEGGGGGRQDNDVSGRRDTGTGDYRDSDRPADVAARKEYEVNRRAREKAAKAAEEARKKAEKERQEKERVQKQIDEYNKEQAKKAKAFKDKTMADLLADEEDEKDDIKSGAIQDLFENEFRRVDRKRFTPPGLLGLGMKLLNPLLAKGSKYNRQFFTKNVAPPGFDKMSLTQRNKAYSDYMGARQRGEVDAYGNKISNRGGGGGGGSQPIIPITQQTPKSQDDTEEEDFQLALAFRADGGRVPYADGGIMDLESARQMLFLGGIAKGIKKGLKSVTRGIKKVVKSPLGKAALLGLGAYYMPGFGIKASGGFSPFLKKFGFDAISKKVGEASFGKLAGLSIGGGLLAGALAGKGYEDEDEDGFDDKTGFSVEEYRRRGAQGNVPIAFRAEGGMSDVENDPQYKGWKRIYEVNPDIAEMHPKHKEFVKYYANVDRDEKAEGGLMDLKGMEMDFREEGGFVPIGKKERADDVPARLSKNEFVMTADAVRGAGDGDIDKGAEKMYNLMDKLEAENDQSQGLDGARKMFKTAQRLEEVL